VIVPGAGRGGTGGHPEPTGAAAMELVVLTALERRVLEVE